MEQLTFDGYFCDIVQCTAIPCPYGGNCDQKKVWERLEEYEESGLSPNACAMAAEVEKMLSDIGWSYTRLHEVMKADKDGRLVILPREEVKEND